MCNILKDRVLGSLYGMACGDAMGVPSSFMSQRYISETWGWIDTFLPPEKGHIFHDGLKAGEYTDDTEQALGLMNSFIRHKRVVPVDVANEILLWAKRVQGKYASPLGPSTERALKAIVAGGDITTTGRWGNTNGSAMRISPIGVIHGIRRSSLEETVRDVYMTCMPTHNTNVCVSGAAAIAWGIACCMQGDMTVDRIVAETMRAADLGAEYGYELAAPSVSRRIALAVQAVKEAENETQAMKDLNDLFGGGDLVADSIPAAIGLFVLGGADPRKVIELAVNFGSDCDTNAAMAGAMAGALRGAQAIPEVWMETIRTVNHIDLERYADDMIALSRDWTTAAQEDCVKCFRRK